MTADSSPIYYRAGGRALDAIEAHQAMTLSAQEDIQGFVMLCGADRAFGGPDGLRGLHFSGPFLPSGWLKNANAPLMAQPDLQTTRGKDLAKKMRALKLPDKITFSALLGKPIADATFCPSYVQDSKGWLIRCPVDENGAHIVPPDSTKLAKAPKDLAPAQHWNRLSVPRHS